MKNLFLFWTLSFSGYAALAQSSDTLVIKFTQAWVWEYQNDLIDRDEPGHQGEMVVYFDPDSNFWLFTGEAYGTSGEMFDWVIGKPDGTYILSTSDEFGSKAIIQQQLEFPCAKNLPEYYIPTGKAKLFNQNKLGFADLEGKEFKIDYLKTLDQSADFIVEFEANFLPLYFFNRLDSEAKLPVQFPTDLPSDRLLLEENSLVGGRKIHLRFKEISHTEYFIDLTTIKY